MPLTAAEQKELDILELKHLESKAKGAQQPPMVSAAEQPSQTTASEAGLQGFGQGATLGYLPEIQAAVGSVANKVLPESMGGTDQSYEDIKKEFKSRDKTLASEHPVATGVGNLAGAVASSALIPGGSAAKGASFLSRVGRAAATGAAYGGLSNTEVQSTEQDPHANLKQRLMNAGIGAGVGGAGEGFIGGIGQAIEKRGERLSQQAVTKQISANAGQVKKILQKDELPKITNFMQDEGLMKAGKSAEDVAEHTKKILDTDGPAISNLYKTTQEEAQVVSKALGKGRPGTVDGNELADEIVKSAKSKFKYHANRDLVTKEIESSVAPLRDMGENANLVDLHDFRKSLDENINWSQKANERDAVQNAFIDARNKVADATKSAMDGLDKTLPGDSRVELLKKLNQRYSTASTVNNISTQGVARETVKAFMGHGVIGAGAGTGAGYLEYQRSHDPIKSLGVGALTALGVTGARKYGAPIGFYGGKAMQGAGKAIQTLTPTPYQVGAGVTSPWVNLQKEEKK